MQCDSCQAVLAPSAANCLFCGAAQASVAPGGAPRGLAYAHSQLLLLHNGASEAWRVWLSFFLCGLYAPLAGEYLHDVAAHHAGRASSAPTPPSGRGLMVLALFFLVPTVLVLVFGFTINASDVYWDFGDNVWRRWSQTYVWAMFNLPVAWFFALSVFLARRQSRRYRLLLFEATNGYDAAMRAYARGIVWRTVAEVVSFLPLLVLVADLLVIRQRGWTEWLESTSALYLFTAVLAAWTSSWLHIDAQRRFYAAATSSVP